jgi:tetratricopeptide (TPR) repeat protein
MMFRSKGPIFLFSLMLSSLPALAQDAKQMHETARTFMLQRDYANAILVLNRAIRLDPKNIEIAKDLGLNYYFAKEYERALSIYKPLLERDDADDQCFQVTGDIYQALELPRECEKVYRRGIKKFPNSGPLYNELGELLWAQKDYSAIKQWEKGIETDPGFSTNYLNATRYYFLTKDKVWSVLYGETYLNIEPQSGSAEEIKTILLESYKKLFSEADLEKGNTGSNPFLNAYLHTMNKLSPLAASGIDAESLTMIRSRFILEWFAEYGTRFPYRLFDLQRQLMQEGLYDAYNQWLFLSVQNLPVYQNWINAHATEYNELTKFQRGRIFKIPPGQYYH